MVVVVVVKGLWWLVDMNFCGGSFILFYFILIRYLYYFNEMNVKIESLMLGVL